MNKLQSLRLNFVGLADTNWKALASLVVALAFFLAISLNVPIGSPEIERGHVVSLSATHSTRLSLAMPAVRVVLRDGSLVDVVLPNNVTLEEGQEVLVNGVSFLMGGKSYAYGGVVNAQ